MPTTQIKNPIKRLRGMMFLLLIIVVRPGFGQAMLFSGQQIREDLAYLKRQLERRHPNIYLYNTPAEFQDFFARAEVPEQVNEQQAYTILSASGSVIQDGHTLFFPGPAVTEATEGYFPLCMFWDGAQMFVRKNYPGDNGVEAGVRIVSINGLEVEAVVGKLLQGMSRDGQNITYPIWVLNQYFFAYFSYFYGFPDAFSLVLEDDRGSRQSITLPAISRTELRAMYESAGAAPAQALYATIDPTNDLAILTVKDWHSDVLRKQYHQRFRPVITQLMARIQAAGVNNLIIDVRDNQGGDTQNSRLLLSYLLADPFQLVEGYWRMKHDKLTPSQGPQMGWHKSRNDAFSGKVFVLINGGSFSNSGIFCAVLQKTSRATFIGEETGGSAYVLAGYTKTITLPNTRVSVEIPTLRFLLQQFTPNTSISGIKPDYEVKPTIGSLLAGKDLALAMALTLIKENH